MVVDATTIVPAVLQNENHIEYQGYEMQEELKAYGTVLESWFPLGGRGYTTAMFNNEIITELAKKYNKTSAQILLRWHIQSGFIAIPGSSNPDHIYENFNIFDFELTEDEMTQIKTIDKRIRHANY